MSSLRLVDSGDSLPSLGIERGMRSLEESGGCKLRHVVLLDKTSLLGVSRKNDI